MGPGRSRMGNTWMGHGFNGHHGLGTTGSRQLGSPGFWGLETGRWAIPPTPGMRWGTDGEQRKNKERINDKTMIQSWQIIQMQVDTQDQADKLMRIGEIG